MKWIILVLPCLAMVAAHAEEWTVYPTARDGMSGVQQMTNAFTRMSSGDTIIVKPGTYDFTDVYMDIETYSNGNKTYLITNHIDLVSNKRSFTLRGDTTGHWDDSVVFKGNGRFLDAMGSNKNIAIENITFDGFDCGRYPSSGSFESRGGCLKFDNWKETFSQMATNCVFRNCKAYIGGAVNGGLLVDCVVSNNWSSSHGGGVVNTRIIDCELRSNVAGGKYGACNGHFGMMNSILEGNYSADVGGATSHGSYAMSNCTFTANSSKGDGGAVYVSNNTPGDIIDCTFVSNVSTNSNGGAIAVDSSKGAVRIEQCRFTGNMATASSKSGGAIWCGKESEIASCSFTNNYATMFGGAVYNGALTNCTLSGNGTIMRGAGIYGGSAVDSVFVDNVKKDITGKDTSIHREFGGGDAYGASLLRCDCNGGMFWRCSLLDCTIHDVTNSIATCVFYEENFATNCLVYNVNIANQSMNGIFWRYMYNPSSDESRGLVPGSYVNCTFADNVVAARETFAVRNSQTNEMSFVNCLFYNTRDKDGALCDISGSSRGVISFTNCLWGEDTGTIEKTGSGNIVCADPKFDAGRTEGVPNYSLRPLSPAKDAGVVQNWMTGATDILGTNRVIGASVDIGCYETYLRAPGFILIFH